MRAQKVELLATTSRRGRGVDGDDPIRIVYELWTMGGECVASFDEYGESFVNPAISELVDWADPQRMGRIDLDQVARSMRSAVDPRAEELRALCEEADVDLDGLAAVVVVDVPGPVLAAGRETRHRFVVPPPDATSPYSITESGTLVVDQASGGPSREWRRGQWSLVRFCVGTVAETREEAP